MHRRGHLTEWEGHHGRAEHLFKTDHFHYFSRRSYTLLRPFAVVTLDDASRSLAIVECKLLTEQSFQSFVTIVHLLYH